MEQSRPTLTWDSYEGILHGTIMWDSYVGLLHGTLTWDSSVGLLRGTLTWDSYIGILHWTLASCQLVLGAPFGRVYDAARKDPSLYQG